MNKMGGPHGPSLEQPRSRRTLSCSATLPWCPKVMAVADSGGNRSHVQIYN